MSRHEDIGIDYLHNPGSRKSGKSDNCAIFLNKSMNVVDDKGEFVKASAVVIKKQANTMEEVWAEYSKFAKADEDPPKCVKTRMTWEYSNGNYVKFKPWIKKNGEVQNKQGSGWAAMEGEYVFLVLEEGYEFTPEDRQDIMEAFRTSNPNAKVVMIIICNPWFPNNPYIKFLNRHLPFNKKILRFQGYQTTKTMVNELAEAGIQNADFKPERHLFIYCNWRINPLLPQSAINTILKAYVLNPSTAETADLGVPGYAASSCYGELVNNITDAVWEKKDMWLCGGDEGMGTESSGKTSFSFQGYNIDGYLDRYAEYVWDNSKYRKTANEQAYEILDFYENCKEEYENKTGDIIKALIVRVDKSAISFIDCLNKEAYKRGLDWINFVSCSKYEIRDRVLVTNVILDERRLRVDKFRCQNFLQEMSNAVWDEKQTIHPKRKDKNDHSLNDFEYGIEPVQYNGLISREKQVHLWQQFSKRGKSNIKI